MYRCVLIILCSIVVYKIITRRLYRNEGFDIGSINTSKVIIQQAGSYNLNPNTTYYFNMVIDNSYLLPGNPRTIVSIELPTDVSNGDAIVLIDRHDRYGWGNLSYDYKIEGGNIRGELSSKNLFMYRGGYMILIWNSQDEVWESNGQKGIIKNDWNGWYELTYKGVSLKTSQETSLNTVYPSYMRIDATQNPVLVTYYGGTKMHPMNIVIKADIGLLNETLNQLEIPVYPSRLTSVMDISVPVLHRLKNGIILDMDKGGGWKKNDRVSLNEKPQDLNDLN